MRRALYVLFYVYGFSFMLKLENINVQYPDGRLAVQDFSCHVTAGERVALLGANGAGKSSLLLAMVGLAPVVSGKLSLAGVELGSKTHRIARQKCGLVFQNPDDQLFSIRVKDDIAFGPQNLGWSKVEIDAKVIAVMQRLDIAKLAEYPPTKLSGGEKRKVALAGVLVMEPEVILLDEPTAFLDPKAQRELAGIVGGLGQTCLIATHDLAFAQKVCSRALVLHEGRLMYDGSLGALLADSQMLERYGLM